MGYVSIQRIGGKKGGFDVLRHVYIRDQGSGISL